MYPGSPVSITRREVGQRKVNLFEVGKPPGEYLLDTPHFEEVVVKLDPFVTDENPLEAIKKRFEQLHPNAKPFLTVTGYINGKELAITESDLIAQIQEIAKGRCQENPCFELRDIQKTLENDLFKIFMHKLNRPGYKQEKAGLLRNITIQAMMEARL